MKRIVAISLACVLVLTLALTGCSQPAAPAASSDAAAPSEAAASSEAASSAAAPAVTDDASVKVVNLWSFTDEIPKMMTKYKELHPEFTLEVKPTIVATTDGAYQPALDQAMAAGGADAPDMYAAESAFVLKYTQGDASSFAAAYKDLGIDVDAMLKEADIAQYTVDIGTRPSDKALVALGYQATGGAYIYRRSIAKEVFGTDDPATIKDKVGPGLDKFWAAAKELKAKGYGIISGDGDLWQPLKAQAEKGWVVDGKFTMDPTREAFFDYSKKLTDEGISNVTQDWQDAWNADMKDGGPKKIFGFFGPAWLINYVMAGNSGGKKPGEGTYGDWAVCESPIGFWWGGTWVLANKDTKVKASVGNIIKWITLDSSDTGLQYFWANGTLNGPGGTKDTVASATVMKKSDGKVEFLGGQNMFDVFVPAGKANINTKNMTQYDETINLALRDQVRQYAAGKKTKEAAIKDFKAKVAESLDITVE